jgi:Leucine-rich repeat (LRR) protein
MACRSGKLATAMAVLLSALASTHAWAASPDTQLVDAAKNGSLAEVKDALSAGARINTKSGPTALLECLGTQQFDHTREVIQLLLAHGADINAPGPDGLSAFQLVLNSWYCDEYLPLFLPLHPDFKATTKDGDGVVALAIRRGALQLARSMLDQGAPGDLPNLAGVTPLMLAAQGDRNQAWRESEYVDMAKVLLSKGADPLRTDKAGKNAADYALDNNNYDLLVLLDSKRVQSSKYDEVKKADLAQKLSAAVERDRWSKIKMIGGPKVAQIDTRGIITSLLKEGADPNAPAVGQPTTIFGQALGDRLNGPPIPPDPGLIQLLLDHGANPNQGFADGNVPLALAVAQQPDLTEFPAAAYQLIGLTRLNIDNTKLAVIPSQIGEFRLLQQASFRANQISMIEDGFYDLVNLTDLDLGTNRLTTVSPRLGGLTQLTNLMLDDNRIADLPDVWDKMVSLKTLSLSGNRLSKLPRTLALAPQLSVLSLNDNMLSELPEEWGKFALDYFNLSQNRFTSFPKEIWNIQIHRLEMANNEITEIPPELASESGLEELDLSGNLITTIPDLSQTHLTQLQLSNNRIKSFPADKRAFPATLRELNLSRNEITEVPDWVFDLNLQSLSLEGNPLPEETIRSAEQRVRQAYESRRLQNHKH